MFQGSGLRVRVTGFRVKGLRIVTAGLRWRVQGAGLRGEWPQEPIGHFQRTEGVGCRVLGLGMEDPRFSHLFPVGLTGRRCGSQEHGKALQGRD
jgi:hypothetical protein